MFHFSVLLSFRAHTRNHTSACRSPHQTHLALHNDVFPYGRRVLGNNQRQHLCAEKRIIGGRKRGGGGVREGQGQQCMRTAKPRSMCDLSAIGVHVRTTRTPTRMRARAHTHTSSLTFILRHHSRAHLRSRAYTHAHTYLSRGLPYFPELRRESPGGDCHEPSRREILWASYSGSECLRVATQSNEISIDRSEIWIKRAASRQILKGSRKGVLFGSPDPHLIRLNEISIDRSKI